MPEDGPSNPKRCDTQGRRHRSRGVELVEFGLVLVPMLGFVFVTIDIGWAIFARSTLQYAVREGCRYAVTSQTLGNVKDSSGNPYGQIDSIKYVVQHNAVGTLGSTPADPGWNLIHVRFYAPADLKDELAPPTKKGDAAINVGGNIVQVSVEGFRLAPLLPLLRDATPLTFTALSADRMEATPGNGPPNYTTGLGY